MKKMKKPTVVVLSIILVFALTIGALAAVYILQQAKVTIFNGRLGGVPVNNDDESAAELVVMINGRNVGHEAEIMSESSIIPVLADVRSYWIDGNYVWRDLDGNEAFVANEFTITAKGGALDNLTYDINVVGNDSIKSVLRFGFTVSHYDDEEGYELSRTFSTDIRHVALPETLGDGNIAEDEEIKVSVVVWADAYALADLERFDDMSFSIDIIFTAGEPV